MFAIACYMQFRRVPGHVSVSQPLNLTAFSLKLYVRHLEPRFVAIAVIIVAYFEYHLFHLEYWKADLV